MTTVPCLFAKAPRPGAVKTRLIPALGPQGAAQVAQALLTDALTALAHAQVGPAVLATDDPPALQAWLDASWPVANRPWVWDQGDGSLSDRLTRVLSRALQVGDAALAVGADTVGLSPAALREAHLALASHDAALGRAADGGFWCLGLRRLPEGLFTPMRWSAPTTADQMAQQLRASGLSVVALPEALDLDEPADLAAARLWLAAHPHLAPALRAALEACPAGAAALTHAPPL